MIFPYSVSSFRDLRQTAAVRAATDTSYVGTQWVRRRPSVNKPASHRQRGIARRQASQRSTALSGRLMRLRDQGSLRASKGGCGIVCTSSVVDTERPYDMLENREKGSKFREVVGLPVPPSSTLMRRVEKLRSRHRRTIGLASTALSAAGSRPLMGRSDTIRWRLRDVAGVPVDPRKSETPAFCASRAPRNHALERFRAWAQRSIQQGTLLKADAAWALQHMSAPKRSTWGWELVNEETA